MGPTRWDRKPAMMGIPYDLSPINSWVWHTLIYVQKRDGRPSKRLGCLVLGKLGRPEVMGANEVNLRVFRVVVNTLT